MKPISMEQVQQYWKDQKYSPIARSTIHDFCRMWAQEEGFLLPDTFDVAAHNSRFFTKINGEKHIVNGILTKFGYPVIETESLTMDLSCAIMRAKQLFEAYGHGVIRANKMAGGGGTFIIQKPESIPMMVSTLLRHPKGPVLPLFSPYYDASVEYGVFLVNGHMELCIAKKRNEETGLHNLTLGAVAAIVTDPVVLSRLEEVCSGLSDLFGIGFGRIDILETGQGLKIVELSVPNFKKFSLQDRTCMTAAKQLFFTYYQSFYAK